MQLTQPSHSPCPPAPLRLAITAAKRGSPNPTLICAQTPRTTFYPPAAHLVARQEAQQVVELPLLDVSGEAADEDGAHLVNAPCARRRAAVRGLRRRSVGRRVVGRGRSIAAVRRIGVGRGRRLVASVRVISGVRHLPWARADGDKKGWVGLGCGCDYVKGAG